MDPNIEIRRLLPSHLKELSSRLETNEYWKHLMKLIPINLDENDFKCDISAHNHHKYHSEHFRLIENHSEKSKRTCTEILFDEWGTSGRIRPTLGHLLYLLVKAKLFKAADYVAIEILHQPKPKRPEGGPEAEVTVDLEKIMKQEDEIEKLLDDMDYPSAAVNLIRNNSAKEASVKTLNFIPAIVVTPDADEDRNVSVFGTPVVPQREINQPKGESVSDMMIFSSDDNRTSTSTYITEDSNGSTDSSDSNQNSGPVFSAIFGSSKANEPDYIPAFSQIADEIQNLPDLSLLNLEAPTRSDSESLAENSFGIPDLPALQVDTRCEAEETGILPDFGALNGTKSAMNVSSDTTPRSPCSSPLPALSLNTELPHFNYSKLAIATNDFHEAPFTDTSAAGRFLGSGEFGSVFLAPNLMDRRVAVKKLSLGGLQVVEVDDQVTKQFRNEVEVLSRYEHHNLVKLLGFSCDGCTYCLLYEFIPGGALRDRLQVDEGILSWKQRLNIAVGTSKAIAYLHTAFSSPLIHRDVKSANILLDANCNPKLCDFGLIKLIPNQNAKVATSVFGTSAYMPREAFAGDISVKLDTFSFGVVLLELITSLPPVDDDREGSDLVTHINETVEDDNILPLVDFRAGIWFEKDVNYAQGLYAITMKCLMEKKYRPTMVEVKMDLDELTKCIQLF